MLEFFDAKCMIGRRLRYRENGPKSNSDLFELMDRCNIRQAMVFHSVAKEADIRMGNKMVVEETVGDNCFFRQWCVVPNTKDDFFEPNQLVEEMKKHDVSSVRLYPKTFGHSTQPYVLSSMMRAFAEHHVPVFVDADEVAGDTLYQICKDYSDTTFVVTHPDYGNSRWYYPVLKQCSNLYMGTSNYLDHNGIKEFTELFGAERMIFETGLPVGSACAAVSLVCYADINMEDKQMIASGNMKRLLAEVCL